MTGPSATSGRQPSPCHFASCIKVNGTTIRVGASIGSQAPDGNAPDPLWRDDEIIRGPSELDRSTWSPTA
jgi:hypothetical protein